MAATAASAIILPPGTAMTKSDGMPKGVRILGGDDLLALKKVRANVDPALLAAASRGIEFDQRCLFALIYNSAMGSIILVAAIMVFREIIDYWATIVSITVAALLAACLLALLHSLAIVLTWRAWFIFSPGSVVWIRTSFWKTEKKEFSLDEISGITNGYANGGGDVERALYIQTRSEKSGALLHDCGRTGLCAWAARQLLDALEPRKAQFITVDAPASAIGDGDTEQIA